jgi:fatty acid CoA ligase FadD9
MSTDTREERLASRTADLYATDQQFAEAQPSEAISAAIEQPGLRLPQIVQTVLDGYADRPALGQRAAQLVTDPHTGHASLELLPRFDTITYREVSQRVGAVVNALTDAVRPGDRVGLLGFTSVDYTTIDLALIALGAVSVPLQTSAPVTQLRPIVAETEPVVIASSVDYLADAVELALAAHSASLLVVFDYHPQVDDQREALAAAKTRLYEAGSTVQVDTLTEVLDCGAKLPAAQPVISADDDPLTLLVYTSGSTGTPKGAMYPERLVANSWRRSVGGTWGDEGAHPSITLKFHADEPHDGTRRPVRDTRRRRHGVFRRQERSFDVPGGSRAGAANPVELRSAHLGLDLRRGPKRTGPPVIGRGRGDRRTASAPARRPARWR